MTIIEAVEVIREIENNEIIDNELSEKLNEIANKLEVINDFNVNGFKLEPNEVSELYTSVRADLVEETKKHDELCKAILEKAKF